MDAVLLSRLQFAITVGFHFIFPPITIGLAWLIFWFLRRYSRTGDQFFLRHARFWTKLFAVTFAVGVATGITMEFQFGTNWASYSRFVGDIFGAPLAAEGLLAFFLESTFVGVLLFGWNRLTPRVLRFASLMVAVGATLSAFWIIVANSWMQTPAGYRIVGDRVELTNFWVAIFNPSTIPRYVHTIDACLITGAFFMLGVSGWYLWKGRHVSFARESLKISLVVGLIASILQFPLGHLHAVQVAHTQPAKLAAFEGLFETQTHAPLVLFGVPNAEQARLDAAIRIPSGLSLLVGGRPGTEVHGLNDFPREDWPPLGLTFFPFHLMFALGGLFVVVTALGVLLWWRGKLFDNKRFMKLAVFSIPLPILANEFGWTTAEVGRQPWIVYQGVGMRTSDAISTSVPPGQVLASLLLFVLLYTLLFILWIYILRREVARGPEDELAPGAATQQSGAPAERGATERLGPPAQRATRG